MAEEVKRFSYVLGIRDKSEWRVIKAYKNKVFVGTEDEANEVLQKAFAETGQAYELFVLMEARALELLFSKK